MLNAKKELIKLANELPDDINSWYDAVYDIHFKSSIIQSEYDFKNGRYITLEESRERMRKEYENCNIYKRS